MTPVAIASYGFSKPLPAFSIIAETQNQSDRGCPPWVPVQMVISGDGDRVTQSS